jgi:uncharacterized membrane protein
MSSKSVCQVARGWVEVRSFHMRLVVRFVNFTASVRSILDTPLYMIMAMIFTNRFRLLVTNLKYRSEI